MRLILIHCLVFLTQKSVATTILVQAPQSPALDYKAMLRAHGDQVSPSQDYMANHPLLVSREALLNAFADAQRAFLDNSNEEAKLKFMALVDLLKEDDWSKSELEVFLHSYLRLAQLESDAERQTHWLELSLLLGSDLKIDVDLFPPPLLARRLELQAQFPRKTISRQGISPDWTQVLINGVACSKQDCGAWPRLKAKVRVTFLSDQYLPQSQITELEKIENLKPRQVAFVEGNCEQSHWHEQTAGFKNKKAFWNPECERRVLTQNLHPTMPSASALPVVALPAPAKPVYQSGWFWVGVGTVVAIAIVAVNAQKKSAMQTTTTYGY